MMKRFEIVLLFILGAVCANSAFAQSMAERLKTAESQAATLKKENARLKQEIKKLRNQSGKNNSYYGTSSSSVNDDEYYHKEWRKAQAELQGYKEKELQAATSMQEKKDSIVPFLHPTFKTYLLRYHDIDNDGEITMWDMENIFILDFSREGVVGLFQSKVLDIRGVEYCVNLKKINCTGNPIRKLDLSQNPQVEVVVADKCQLTTINVSQNVMLKKLYCANNQLKELNVSNNSNLEVIDCSSNIIAKSIDFSNNTNLLYLNCENNNIPQLSVSNCAILEELYCAKNMLSAITIGPGETMETMDIRSNPRLRKINMAAGRMVKKFQASGKEYYDIMRNHIVVSE